MSLAICDVCHVSNCEHCLHSKALEPAVCQSVPFACQRWQLCRGCSSVVALRAPLLQVASIACTAPSAHQDMTCSEICAAGAASVPLENQRAPRCIPFSTCGHVPDSSNSDIATRRTASCSMRWFEASCPSACNTCRCVWLRLAAFVHAAEHVCVCDCTRCATTGDCSAVASPWQAAARVLLQGVCPRGASCPYSHAAVHPDAPLCPNFRAGYCRRGVDCPLKHLTEDVASHYEAHPDE